MVTMRERGRFCETPYFIRTFRKKACLGSTIALPQERPGEQRSGGGDPACPTPGPR